MIVEFSGLPLFVSISLLELGLNIVGNCQKQFKLGFRVNISVQVLLGNLKVQDSFFDKWVVADGLVLETMAPHISKRYSEVFWWMTICLELLLDCESLMHSRWLKSLRKGVQLNIHVF